MDTLHVRINKDVKAKAGKTLADLGMDMSTAVKVFLNQVILEKGLPFTPTKNPTVLKIKWDKEAGQAVKKGKTYRSAQEMHTDL